MIGTGTAARWRSVAHVLVGWAAVIAATSVGVALSPAPVRAQVAAGTTYELQVTGRGGVPSDATAAVLNIAAVDPQADGFITAFPCGEAVPEASTLNYYAGRTIANNATVAIGTDGKVCLYSLAATDLVADLNGWFVNSPAFTPRSPQRLLDSRQGVRPTAKSITRVQVTGRAGVPQEATAVVLNLAAVDPSADGFVTAFPCGNEPPLASTVNYYAGTTIANNAVVTLGAGGAACLYTHAATDLIADINGWFVPAPGFDGLTPERLLDTRQDLILPAGAVYPLQVTGRAGVPADAAATVLNIAAVDPTAPGFVTAYPCGRPRPTASTVNYLAGVTIANNATVAIGVDGNVCLYALTATHLVVDVNARYAEGGPLTATSPVRLLDTREAPGGDPGGGDPDNPDPTVPDGGGPGTPGNPDPTVPDGGEPGGGDPPPPAGAAFTETFDGNTGVDRFVGWVYHRDGVLVAQDEWPGDYDRSCSGIASQRTVHRYDPNESFYACDDHMMSSIGDTSGYSMAWFSPDDDADVEPDIYRRGAVTSISWDVNVTDLLGRQWWEVTLVDAYQSPLTTRNWMAGAAGLEPYRSTTIAVGKGPFGNADNIFSGGADRDPLDWRTVCGESGVDPDGCASKEIRRRFTITDNRDGTISYDYLGETYTFPGEFPAEFSVYFTAHAFEPTKDATPPGFTWHWDNIVIR